MTDPICILKSLALVSVEFVHDYVQLRFDGPCLTVNAPYVILVEGTSYKKGDPGYRDALCDRIERSVRNARTVPRHETRIEFDDNASLVISLKPEDQVSPEAVVLSLGSEQVYVW